MPILNMAEATEQPQAATSFSESDEIDTAHSTSSKQDVDTPVAINGTDDTMALLPSQSSEDQDPPSGIETTNVSREPEENESTTVASKNTTKRKYANVLDSDSEQEDDFIASLLNKSRIEESDRLLESEATKSGAGKLGKGSRRMIDSESEEENSVNAVEKTNREDEDGGDGDESSGKLLTKKVMKSRFRTLVDSESEDDNELKPSPNSDQEIDEKMSSDESTTAKRNKKQKISSIVDSTSEDDEDSKKSVPRSSTRKNKKSTSNRNKKTKPDDTIAKSKISSLIDTDSEGDDNHDNDGRTTPIELHEGENHEKKKSTKKRTGSKRASKDEAMRQIHSETQRLIRSTEISLPYHRPKQRSLQEFLNRKQFIPVLPEGLTTAEKIKMSSQIVGKILEEKEKEAELFYKSSDSENDETMILTPVNPEESNELKSSISSNDHLNIEETQKIIKNDVQNAHNKKEIIKQGTVDLGLPRKLFANGDDYPTENPIVESEINDDEITEDPIKKTKEIKHGLREVSVPRKLFTNDYTESVASSNIQECSSSNLQSIGVVDDFDKIVDSTSNENPIVADDETSSKNVKQKLSNVTNDVDAEKINEVAIIANDVDETAKFEIISETPFMSNKEWAKLNAKGKISRRNDDNQEDVEDDGDSNETKTPSGDVHGLPPPNFVIDDSVNEDLSSAKKKISSTMSIGVGPRLRGAPGTLIDLDNDVKPNREGVKCLVDRFIRHSTVNKPTEISTSVSVLHTEKTSDGLKIIEHVLPYKLPTVDDSNDKELSKPGAKYRRLKNELMRRMAKKRDEEWRLRKEREREDLEESDEEMEEDDKCEDEVEEEEETSEKLEISGESEPEENDVTIVDKKKRRHRDFEDEEAEVSGEDDNEDDEDDDDDEEMEINEEDSDEDEKKNSKENVVDEDDKNHKTGFNEENDAAKKCKKSKRIIKAFEDDSESSNDCSKPIEQAIGREKNFERTQTDVDMFAPDDPNDEWSSDGESELPPSQILPRDQADARSQLCKTPLTAVNILRFVSPITQLTALNTGIDSPNDGRTLGITPGSSGPRNVGSSVEKTPMDKQSPITINHEKRVGFQKKLFEDPTGMINDDELMDLCSGRFTGTENNDDVVKSGKKRSDARSSSGFTSSNGLDLGNNETTMVRAEDEASQDIRLTLEGGSEDSRDGGENLDGKSKPGWTNYKVVSSSDEDNRSDDGDDAKSDGKKLKKKRPKKLELSDDEDDDEASSSDDDEEFEAANNGKENTYVDYDSEENEVVVVPEKEIKKVAAGFLDEEAELSESDWGSADEDEKDLDKLELEEADNEEIDEDRMKDQLGKLHVRQVLDDDQREVRMLQEMLFDDGDLHTESGGRERQFKWKNIDNLGDDDKLGPRNDDVDENGDAIEEEDDLEWRKQRLEREKFIEDKMKNSTDLANDELEGDSQIFKLGIKALERSKSMISSQKEPDEVATKKPFVQTTVMDLLGRSDSHQKSTMLRKSVKRGSFLARGDECLARLAMQIQQTETVQILNKPRKFVFERVSPFVGDAAEEEQDVEPTENIDSPANSKTKKRKPPAGVTPRTTKKAKIDVTRSSGKKLFS